LHEKSLHAPSLVAIIAAGLVGVGIVGAYVAFVAHDIASAREVRELRPCVTEDASDCYWDADVMGNGEGRSFVNLDGVVYYEGEVAR